MKRILLVEDNELNRELLRAMAEAAGYEVEEAVNGIEALAALELRLPDLILTDLQMPVMSGSVFLQEVRKRPHLARVKVLAVSAFAMRGDRERALAEGFDGYLTKPVQKAEFREQIRLLLDTPAAERREAS
ncbi:MAG: response regulator [Acidobacteriota bacterium]|nr:response regulator [Acidobacteriota bacterium]